MNRLIDYIKTWADKFVYRIMSLIGVPQVNLDKFAEASARKQDNVWQADAVLSKKVPVLRVLFIIILAFVTYHVIRLFQRYKRR